MIRHITFSHSFVEIKKDGYLRPSEIRFDSAKKDYIVFEKDWHGDAYFKAMFIAKNARPGISYSPNDLIAIIFDEHDLLIKGYQIHETSDLGEKSELKSMLLRKELSRKEYGEIGNLVYMKDDIPLVYMVNIDIPDEKRLKKLGLM